MRIHAIQTGTVAVRSRQREGSGPGPLRLISTLADARWTEPLPILAWVIEHPEGLIVVDTGETANATEPGHFPAWHPYFRRGVREWVEPEQEIGPQIERIGLSLADVRWVVMTHFHTDHAGGLGHFPRHEIVTSRRAYREARGARGRVRGFLPQHWPTGFAPTLVDFDSGPFGSFPASTRLTLAGDVHLLPTPGHTPGHLSVAVEDGDALVFLAGDASYTEQLMLAGRTDGVAPNPAQASDTLTRIQQLVAEQPTIYLPSHDPEAVIRLEGRQAAQPAASRPAATSAAT